MLHYTVSFLASGVRVVLLSRVCQRDEATDGKQRLDIEIEFLRTEADKYREELNKLHQQSMENIRVLKARLPAESEQAALWECQDSRCFVCNR